MSMHSLYQPFVRTLSATLYIHEVIKSSEVKAKSSFCLVICQERVECYMFTTVRKPLNRLESNEHLIYVLPYRIYLPNLIQVYLGVRHDNLATNFGRTASKLEIRLGQSHMVARLLS